MGVEHADLAIAPNPGWQTETKRERKKKKKKKKRKIKHIKQIKH